MTQTFTRFLPLLAFAALFGVGVFTMLGANESGTTPAVGDAAPDFALTSLANETIKLSELTAKGPVVLLVLRGYPGYQCPLCSMQVASFLKFTEEMNQANANVLMVYPGPTEKLQNYAKEFIGSVKLPQHYHLVTDPDFQMVNAYGLRWNAQNETAYPSTFVIDKSGKIQFAKVSKVHAGRTNARDILQEVEKLK